ncbi:DEAD-box ATP-dependent RNA helicase 53-like protein, partial [Tanacetum coccineum]
RGRNPLAIVMTPTRELARQFEKDFYKSAPELDTLSVYDGSLIQRQLRTLNRGIELTVGIRGRVIVLLKRWAINLSKVKFAILDEVDQMLNVGDSNQKLADGVMVYFISSEMRKRPSIIGPLITVCTDTFSVEVQGF